MGRVLDAASALIRSAPVLDEAIPDVMTPCTWSLVRMFMTDVMATSSVEPYLGYGNIGGCCT